MFHIVYKTTNTINNKIYIGAHSTEDINDEYLGSGTSIKKAIKKYNKENFTKEILFEAKSREIAFWIESMFVDDEFVKDKNTYNLTLGGVCPLKANIPWNKGKKGVQVAWNKGLVMESNDEESNKKRSNTLKELYKVQEHHSKGTEPWNKGKKGVQVAWNKGKKAKTVVCDVCGKEGDVGNMRRWHFPCAADKFSK